MDNVARKNCQHLQPGVTTVEFCKSIEQHDLQDRNRLQVGSFTWVSVIGVGDPEHSSKVYKVVRKDSGQTYAIKVLSKRRLLDAQQSQTGYPPPPPAVETDIQWGMDGIGGLADRRGIDIDPTLRESSMNLAAAGQCQKSRGIQHLMHEIAILKMLPSSSFLVHCAFAFQDQYHCYFGLEYMHGGDLRHYLNSRTHTLEHKEVQFYMASMTLALVHLHSNGILHRDVRPEAILIDSKGR